MRALRHLLTALLLCPAALAQQDYRTNPDFQKAMAEGKNHLRHSNEVIYAYGSFKRANKIAGGHCRECIDQMLSSQMKTGEYKGAAETALLLLQASSSPAERADAEVMRGIALLMQGGQKPKQQLLEEADKCFAQSEADDPKVAFTYYHRGRALAFLKRNEEASAQFRKFIEIAGPKHPYSLRAQHFAETPALATQLSAPPLHVTTLDGKEFQLDSMNGKVVLIDFWATWCGPCKEELPHMKELAKKFSKDPFELISISWDSDESKWKEFVAKNGMTWNQYRDATHSLSTQFGVSAIPHYFTIDSDGILQAEKIGSGADIEGKIKKLIAKAKADQQARNLAGVSQLANTGNGD